MSPRFADLPAAEDGPAHLRVGIAGAVAYRLADDAVTTGQMPVADGGWLATRSSGGADIS